MESETPWGALDCALEALETLEYRVLAWGYVDGSLSEAEAEATIAKALSASGWDIDASDVLDDLVETRLVRLWRNPNRRYRTRFAELVRLLVRLRQLYDGRDWRSAPSLVSDFRVDIRRRQMPRADVDPCAVFGDFSSEIAFTDLQRRLWETLTQSDKGFKLRRFQTTAAKRLLNTPGEHGTIITAGTGSGKTLAFYLPALVSIGDGLREGDFWTRALCIYPRKELLKDQFTEAYRLCRKAAPILRSAGRRQFSLGALYSEIPGRADKQNCERAGWRWQRPGYVCPFLRCPECGSEMTWHIGDLDAGIERLQCSNLKCGGVLGRNEVRLTRNSILQNPPDLLFTTTEMLNQRLSDTRFRQLFGVGRPREQRPQFCLLDEVHTYAGTTGAQVAILMRRWRHLLGSPIRWAGLSATLREAPIFFSELTGLWPDAVAEVTPLPSDMDKESAEYQVILRSDPASQTSTLSSTIQAAMLIGRMLEPADRESTSGDRFGRRLFAFTDDLDVTHRLFDNLRDAEAYNRFGRADPNRRPLAALRSDAELEPNAREVEGQRWAFAERLQGALDRRLVIGRTTSRDPGVDGRADVIVATAALEVGFNDPEVGAVLQHKAPRSFAAFLQRRGRAGRRRHMRPLTATVLSDYGRDRIAFQGFEHLFDPVVERQPLPVSNTYVLRIQATFALFDWIADRVARAGGQGWAWDVLSRPLEDNEKESRFRKAVKSELASLTQLKSDSVNDLSAYLKSALQVSDDQVRSVLWDPPRPILLEAVPTLARRFFRNWRLADNTGFDLMAKWHPLPDFVPRTLFDELNLPEVRIEVPPATKHSDAKTEHMSILQALNQFAPGRVRRRFADEYGGLAHWLPVPEPEEHGVLCVDAYATVTEVIGRVTSRVAGEDKAVNVYRPHAVSLVKAPSWLLPTSQGTWNWQSSFVEVGDPLTVELSERSLWAATIPQIKFFLHQFSAAVEQWRFATGGTAELRQRSGALHVSYHLVDKNDYPAAIGFAFEADSLIVPLHLPDAESLAERELPGDVVNWLRTLRLRRVVAYDSFLAANANQFQLDWLYQILLLTIVLQAEEQNTTFESAANAIRSEADPQVFETAIAAVVSAEVLDEDTSRSGLAESLHEILCWPGVIDQLCRLACDTAGLDGADWGGWLLEVLANTISEGILGACMTASPNNTALDGLTVDMDERAGRTRAVVAEMTPGGGGTIEAVAHAFAVDPRAFVKSLNAALATSDLEDAADALDRIYRFCVKDDEVRAGLSELRAADRTDELARHKERFFILLCERGISISHALSVSIATRLMHPAASVESDALTVDLLDRWNLAEDRFGFALPVRVGAAFGASEPSLRARLSGIAGAEGSEIAVAGRLLWPRKGELRLGALQSYNPYRPAKLTDARLARAVLVEGQTRQVWLDAEKWQQEFDAALIEEGEIELLASFDERSRLREAITRLVGRSIETAYLRIFPCLDSVRRRNDGWAARFFVRESV